MMPKVISVCDREADIKEYMKDKIHHGERFVVRARHNRKLDNSESKLFDLMDKLSSSQKHNKC